MLRGCVLVLVLCALLLPAPLEAGRWFRRWNWRKIGEQVVRWAPVVAKVTGGGKRDLDAMDANGDGVVDVDELANHVGERATRAELEEFMELIDDDGDGQVTRRELENFSL